jgi:hypothetical protein
MRNLIKFSLYNIVVILMVSCSSDDDCTKTIVVQPEQVINTPTGSVYYPEVKQEVPCDAPEPDSGGEVSETGSLENFTYDVLSFNYTPDTGNNTSRLQFEIQLNNANNFPVEGVPVLTLLVDDLQISGSYSADASAPCYEIGANSSCVLVYDQEASLDQGAANSIELLSVEYYISE